MTRDIAFQVFVGGCIFATCCYIYSQKGRLGSWFESLLIWFAILPIPLSMLANYFKSALESHYHLRMWSIIIAPYLVAILVLLLTHYFRAKALIAAPNDKANKYI
jgi:hypothetical protein